MGCFFVTIFWQSQQDHGRVIHDLLVYKKAGVCVVSGAVTADNSVLITNNTR